MVKRCLTTLLALFVVALEKAQQCYADEDLGEESYEGSDVIRDGKLSNSFLPACSDLSCCQLWFLQVRDVLFTILNTVISEDFSSKFLLPTETSRETVKIISVLKKNLSRCKLMLC